MPQDYKDYVFANGGIEGQVTPTTSNSPGAFTSASSVYIATPGTAQVTSQSNPFPGNAALVTGVVAVAAASSTPGGKAGAQ